VFKSDILFEFLSHDTTIKFRKVLKVFLSSWFIWATSFSLFTQKAFIQETIADF
jgi:hypothetical protein